MLHAGQQFAGLYIVGSLRTGAAGDTYLVRPPSGGEDVLLVVPEALSADPAYRQAFATAAAQAATLTDPAVLKVRGHGQDGGRLWLASEYAAGTTLASLVQRTGPLAPGQVAAAITAVAGALDQAHSRGLLRGAVSAADVVVPEKPGAPQYRVGGFGLPPAAATDARGDQAGLGDLATFLLTGGQAIGQRVTTVRPELPAAVDEVLGRVRRPAPERYESCGAMAAALTAALTPGQATVAAATPSPGDDATLPFAPGETPAPGETTVISGASAASAGATEGSGAASPLEMTANPYLPNLSAGQGPGAPGPAASNAGGPDADPTAAGAPGHGQPTEYSSPPAQAGGQPPTGYGAPPTGYGPTSHGPTGYDQASYGQAPTGHPGYGPAPHPQQVYSAGGFGPYGPGQPPLGPGDPNQPSGEPRGNTKLVWVIAGVLVAVIAVVGALIAFLPSRDGDDSDDTATSATASSGPSSAPSASSAAPSVQVVAGIPVNCVQGAPLIRTSSTSLDADAMRIPAEAVPTGWRADAGSRMPFVVDSDAIAVSRPPGQNWQAQLGVATLPSNFTGDIEQLGRKWLECLNQMPGYVGTDSSPAQVTEDRGGATDSKSVRVHFFEGRIPVKRGDITADDFVLLIADTTPRSIAFGVAANTDPQSLAEIGKAIADAQIRTR
ncbi:hypothetical protein GOHSU_48_00220 [Gordonia hirsuta DSM 44140 = NBRC 16056]|uniref:Serine/threonine protein kinase n=1 Tax=Gordonia hirsuta DSM 44140 = NBRC 16056 TaxID=1121927 RepID=L7LFA5_9ACTN|nr:hypothetical protein [Gordonia hirsuta]GAC58762.1 hypothetical protein GOHSU_48_00220 [Gordonia hirsuta DSM 44140 = NBRC 16056]